jgi:hypothetical protein
MNGKVVNTVSCTENGGSSFQYLPSMPESKSYHMLMKDGGNIFVAGGENEIDISSTNYFLYERNKNE